MYRNGKKQTFFRKYMCKIGKTAKIRIYSVSIHTAILLSSLQVFPAEA